MSQVKKSKEEAEGLDKGGKDAETIQLTKKANLEKAPAKSFAPNQKLSMAEALENMV